MGRLSEVLGRAACCVGWHDEWAHRSMRGTWTCCRRPDCDLIRVERAARGARAELPPRPAAGPADAA